MSDISSNPNNSTGYVRDKIALGIPESWRSAKIASAVRRQLMATRDSVQPMSTVWDVFERYADVTDDYEIPFHLAPYVDEISQGLEREVRLCFHAPPRHGKSLTTLLIIAYLCRRYFHKQHAYITYNATMADEAQHEFCAILSRLGIKHRRSGDIVRIDGGHNGRRSRDGDAPNSVIFTSINGSLTGRSITGIAVLDDPIKGADAAASQRERDNCWNFFNQELRTRKTKGRLSIVVMMTRWHADDLTGRLVDTEWPYIRIPALCDTGPTVDPLHRQFDEPLFPFLQSFESLEKERQEIGTTAWAAMYQGVPVAEGARPFNGVTTYSSLPTFEGAIWTYGFDLAGTERGSADWTVGVRLLTDPVTRLTYVHDVVRRQKRIVDLVDEIREFMSLHPGEAVWMTGGQEATIVDFLRKEGIPMTNVRATKGKYQRAVHVMSAWNEGRIRVPVQASPQVIAFTKVVHGFTGIDGDTDDDVDALSAAYHPIVSAKAATPFKSFLKTEAGKRLIEKQRLRRGV
jgi:hypothetical protein